MEERKMSEKEAMELIARSLEAQRRKLSFVRSTLFFGAGALALAVTTADYVVRRTTGRDLTLMLVLAGTVAGLAALYFHYRSHRTVTANDRTLMNVRLSSFRGMSSRRYTFGTNSQRCLYMVR